MNVDRRIHERLDSTSVGNSALTLERLEVDVRPGGARAVWAPCQLAPVVIVLAGAARDRFVQISLCTNRRDNSTHSFRVLIIFGRDSSSPEQSNEHRSTLFLAFISCGLDEPAAAIPLPGLRRAADPHDTEFDAAYIHKHGSLRLPLYQARENVSCFAVQRFGVCRWIHTRSTSRRCQGADVHRHEGCVGCWVALYVSRYPILLCQNTESDQRTSSPYQKFRFLW
jgi:hypothetical protein